MKFRFFLGYTNARESSYGASLSEGNDVHARGWNAGAKITPRTRNRTGAEDADADEYEVAMTWGSNGGNRSVLLGTVRDTPDGPVWMPNGDLPASYLDPDATAPPRLRKHRRRRPVSRSRFTPEAHMTMTPAQPAPATETTLARINAVLTGKPLDVTVFGPENNLAGHA